MFALRGRLNMALVPSIVVAPNPNRKNPINKPGRAQEVVNSFSAPAAQHGKR